MKVIIDNTTYEAIGYWVDARTGDKNMQLVSMVGSVRQHRIKAEDK